MERGSPAARAERSCSISVNILGDSIMMTRIMRSRRFRKAAALLVAASMIFGQLGSVFAMGALPDSGEPAAAQSTASSGAISLQPDALIAPPESSVSVVQSHGLIGVQLYGEAASSSRSAGLLL